MARRTLWSPGLLFSSGLLAIFLAGWLAKTLLGFHDACVTSVCKHIHAQTRNAYDTNAGALLLYLIMKKGERPDCTNPMPCGHLRVHLAVSRTPPCRYNPEKELMMVGAAQDEATPGYAPASDVSLWSFWKNSSSTICHASLFFLKP